MSYDDRPVDIVAAALCRAGQDRRAQGFGPMDALEIAEVATKAVTDDRIARRAVAALLSVHGHSIAGENLFGIVTTVLYSVAGIDPGDMT